MAVQYNRCYMEPDSDYIRTLVLRWYKISEFTEDLTPETCYEAYFEVLLED